MSHTNRITNTKQPQLRIPPFPAFSHRPPSSVLSLQRDQHHNGKTPINKKELIKERSRCKKEAEIEYYSILKEQDYQDKRLIELKKKFVRVNQENITMLKNVMTSFNVEIIQCEWEADAICANYVKSGAAWACLSDDMDMLVYGCGKVIWDFSLQTLSAQLYILPNILKE